MKAHEYDEFYGKKDFLHFKQDGIYVQLLCSFLPDPEGSSVLDVGCGRGYWSRLFHECGVGRIVGIDISSVGLEFARRAVPAAEFLLGDAAGHLPFEGNTFDMVFCQGLSVFNVDDFTETRAVGLQLLHYLKSNGLFVFANSTNLSGKRKNGWMQHKQDDFLNYLTGLGCRIEAAFFIDRAIFLRLFGKNVVKSIFSKYAVPAACHITGFPGYMVCIARKGTDNAAEGYAAKAPTFKHLSVLTDPLHSSSRN